MKFAAATLLATSVAAGAADLFATRDVTDLGAFGCSGCNCGEMECETRQSACIFDALAQGNDSLPESQAFDDIKSAVHSQMGVPEGPKLDAIAHEYTEKLMDGRSSISRGEFRGVYDAFRVEQLGCAANGGRRHMETAVAMFGT